MNDKQKAEYRSQAMIPDGVSLEIDKFGKFFDARKELLAEQQFKGDGEVDW